MKRQYTSIFLALAVTGLSQTLTPPLTPTAGPAATDEPTVLGLKQKAFIAAQAALTDTELDPDVAKLNAQIATLMDQRDAAMLAAALKAHPELANDIKVVADAITKAKTKTK